MRNAAHDGQWHAPRAAGNHTPRLLILNQMMEYNIDQINRNHVLAPAMTLSSSRTLSAGAPRDAATTSTSILPARHVTTHAHTHTRALRRKEAVAKVRCMHCGRDDQSRDVYMVYTGTAGSVCSGHERGLLHHTRAYINRA